jgi:glyoxylase-like metal-dependent hydrolase (beta-lactamase superfamily II)
MVVIKLSDGSLFVHSPLDLTEEVVSFMSLLGGPVQHVVLPNNSPEHWHFAPQWAEAFPDATIYAAPGLDSHLELPEVCAK